MGYTNATDEKAEVKKNQPKVAVNSIQTTALVKRLCIHHSYNLDGIISYDNDNLYPEKVISIKQRSWALTSATKTLSDFITGDGFEDETLNDLVLNSEGLTGYDLLRDISDQKSEIAFAIHINYNIQGVVSEINLVDFESFRVTEDGRLVWRKDWSQIGMMNGDVIYYNFFNPDNVSDEIIKAGGIEKYNGQILYWTGTNKIYPLAPYDAAIDSGQYQAEAELFKLRNIQNDFSGSGAFQYPANLDNDADFITAKNKLKNEGTGANNAGTTVFVGTTPDNEGAKNLWHPFERKGVDKLYELQNKEAKEAIFSVFRQPMILGAINPGGGWPNSQEMEDAFVYYNSITERDRQDTEKALTKIFEASIFEVADVKIKPKMLIKSVGTGEEKPKPEETGGEE